MSYALTTRRRRRNSAMGEATLGFDWGGLFTNISASAATGAAQAGISRLTQAIAGSPKPPANAPPPGTSTLATGAGGIPIWGWAVGGIGLVLVLVLAMGRR